MSYENRAEAADQQLAAHLAPNLALLATLSETRNITRAAERLGIPQPTVSRRLAALTEAVGAPLTEPELLLSVPKAHRLATRHRIRFAELADEEFVTLEHGYGLRQIADGLCAEAGFEPKIAFEGQESDTVRGLVAAGLGVSLLPRFGPAPPAGVVEIPLSPNVTRTIGLVWPAQERFTPAVRAFRDHVLA